MPENKIRLFLIFNSIFNVLLLLAGIFLGSPFYWGFNTLSFFSTTGIIFFAATGVLIFIPFVNRIFLRGIEDAESILKKSYTLPLLITVYVLFFLVFRIKEHFLGDGPMILRMLPQMTGVSDMIATNEPGSYTLGLFVQDLLRKIFTASYRPEYVYIFLSVLSGAAFVFILYRYTLFIAKNRIVQILNFIILLFTSNFIFFLGYVETYQVVFVLMLLYMVLTVMYFEDRVKTPYFIALVLGIWLSLHYIAAVFLPSFIYILAYRFRKNILQSVISLLIFAASFMLFYYLTGLDFTEMVKRFVEPNTSHWLPLFTVKDGVNPVFSIYHFWDVINSQLLALPFGIFSLIILVLLLYKKINFKDSSVLFMLLMSAGSVLFIFAFNSYYGLSRDWDVAALMSYPFIFFIVLILNKFTDITKYKSTYLICSFIAFWTVMIWIFANTNISTAEKRNSNLADERLWNKHRIVLYYEELGAYYREKQDLKSAVKYFKKGLEIEPDRERLVTNLSYVYYKEKNYAEAEKILKDYVLKGYGKREILVRLGFIQMEERKYGEAIEDFKKVLDKNPSDFEALGNISVCYYMMKDYSSSINYSKKLISFYPENVKPYLSLGDAFLGTGDTVNALNSYNKAAELNKDSKFESEINSRIQHIKK